jgi:hypothetical protein
VAAQDHFAVEDIAEILARALEASPIAAGPTTAHDNEAHP